MAKDNPLVYGYVYLIRNNTNGKIYVGKTIQSLSIRLSEHMARSKAGAKGALYNALRKYGKDNFTISELGRAFSVDELNEMECRAIWSFNAADKTEGYNRKAGGDGGAHSEETKQKIGNGNRGKVRTESMRVTLSQCLYKRWTPELKAKKSADVSGSSNHFYGKRHSDETRKKLSEAASGVIPGDSTRQKIGDAARTMWRDADFRDRMSRQRKELWQDPEYRKKRSEAMERAIAKRRAEREMTQPVLQEVV